MFGKLVLILATVSQARHLRGPGQFNMTNATAPSGPLGPTAGANSSFSLVPYYQQQKQQYPMCPSKQEKQVVLYKNATAFRREL